MNIKTKIILIILFLSPIILFSQEIEKNQKNQFQIEDVLQKTKLPSTKPTQIPLEGAVDPNEYNIGPGDELTIGVWGSLNLNYPLTVSPEGSLIIPSVGVVNVSEKSLTEAKKLIVDAVKKKYPNSEITATLTQPRIFLVKISGMVMHQATFEVNATTRVDKAVILSNQMNINFSNTNMDQYRYVIDPNKTKEIFGKISTRNIKLIRKNGTEIRVDLPLYNNTGLSKYNPYLIDGDRIFVPQKDTINNFLAIYGKVNMPGTFEFIDDDNLETAIQLSGGLTNYADRNNIQIFRIIGNNRRQTINITYPKDKDFKLMSGDQVLIGSFPDKPMNSYVHVFGEIKSPGTYPITLDVTRLSEIIKLASGFTDEADLVSSMVIRSGERMDFVDPRYEFLQNLRGLDVGPMDSLYFINEISINKKPITVDFTKLFVEKDTSYDITLKFGDIVYIPQVKKTVYVSGQVQNPGIQKFNPNYTVEQYIQNAGGFTYKAKEGDIKVIKARTYQWLDPEDTQIQPGDAIWVPRVIEHNFAYYFMFVRDGLGVVASVATIYLLIRQLQ